MKQIIGMGNALVDILVNLGSDALLADLNLPKGSMQLVDDLLSLRVREQTAALNHSLSSGGSAANTIHGLANLGLGTGFVGKVGRDDHGRFFEDEMVETGIRPSLLRSETPTGIAVALISPDSERTFATFLGAAVEMEPSDVQPDLFADYHVLHIEGYLVQNQALIARAVEVAHAAGLLVSLDLASYNVVEANLAFLKSLLPKVDILFANEEEARSFTNLGAVDALEVLAKECPLVVVKVGSKGSYLARGEERAYVPARSVKAIDTTGAGDLYAAGFLFGLLSGDSLETCGKLGTLLASRVIEVIGAKLPANQWIDLREEVDRLRLF